MGRKRKPTQTLHLADITSDTTFPLLQARFIGDRETTASGGTLTVAPTGDDSSELLVTAVGWDKTASPPAARTDLYAGNTTTGATVTATLQALIDAINGDPNGFEVRRAHGMSDLSLATDDFAVLSATQIGEDWTNFLFRDASEYAAIGYSYRIGVPEINKRGRIELLKIEGLFTYTGTSTWKVTSDRGSSAAEEQVLFQAAAAATTVRGSLVDFTDLNDPPVFNGPLAIEITNSGGSITAGEITCLYRPLD